MAIFLTKIQAFSNHNALDMGSVSFFGWQDKVRNLTLLGPQIELLSIPGWRLRLTLSRDKQEWYSLLYPLAWRRTQDRFLSVASFPLQWLVFGRWGRFSLSTFVYLPILTQPNVLYSLIILSLMYIVLTMTMSLNKQLKKCRTLCFDMKKVLGKWTMFKILAKKINISLCHVSIDLAEII
jgi:hypothetical protein